MANDLQADALVKMHQQVLAGGLNEDGSHRPGLVQLIADTADRVSALYEDIRGDGNGSRGLKIRMHDVETFVELSALAQEKTDKWQIAIERKALVLAVGVIATLATSLVTLLKYWVQTGAGS